MFSTILVPLDGSPFAERALPYAEVLARATGARLLLVRAAVARAFSGLHAVADERSALHDAEAYLERVAAQLTERGTPVATATPYGEAADSIVAEAQLRQADLLVMATHGRAGLNRWLYGSVAQAVLTRTAVPVLLVRAWQADSVQPLLVPRPQTIVPLDGSTFAEEAVRPAQGLAARLGGELVLVRAISLPDPLLAPEGIFVPLTPVDLTELREEAREYLRRFGSQLTDGCLVQEEVQVGTPEGVIASVGVARGAALGLWRCTGARAPAASSSAASPTP